MSYSQRTNPLLQVDWVVILLYIALLTFGWFSICGASHEIGDTDFFNMATRTGKQLMWIGLGFGLGIFLLLLDERYFDITANVLYGLMMVVLLITPFVAQDTKGSLSWISFGSVKLQPAEFAKCVTALALAKLIGTYGFDMTKYRCMAKAVGLILLPMVLIVLQKETGSALVYFAFFLMLYREGMPGSFLFTAVAAVLYFVISIQHADIQMPSTLTPVGEFVVLLLTWAFTTGLLRVYLPRTSHARRFLLWGSSIALGGWLVSRFIVPYDVAWVLVGLCLLMVAYLFWYFLDTRVMRYLYIAFFTLGSMIFIYSADYALNRVLQPHQQSRVKVLLGVEEDKSGVGYNVNQSKIAIGSGGFSGKGFMNGTQTKLKYVPEQDTDFIFCTVGEEEGFVGGTVVLLLFLALILRLIYLSERQTTVFGRVYGYCVLSILLFHVLINIGMVMGLMPVIGIPLPFFSYGGSSLWGFTLQLFIFLRIDVGNQARLGC